MKLEKYQIKSEKSNSIVFVHGSGHAAWCWNEYFFKYFNESGYGVCSFSFRGHGKSEGKSKLNSFSMQDYVDDLHDIIRQINKKPIVITHSLGSAIIQRYMVKHPNTICALILLAPTPPKNILWQLFKVKKNMILYRNKDLYLSENIVLKKRKQYKNALQSESIKAQLKTLFRVWDNNYQVDIPCLVIGTWGDRCIPNSAVISMGKFLKCKTIIIPGLCHDMMIDLYWKEVADEILSFLKKAKL